MRNLCTILIMTISGMSFGQAFTFHAYAPFNLKIQNENGENSTLKYIFIDLDSDGDLDVLHTGIATIDDVDYPTEANISFFIEKQINVGNITSPQFGPRQKYADSFPLPRGYFIPSACDLNNDGKIDFIISSEINTEGNQNLLYYKNIGTSLNPLFSIIKAGELELDPFVPYSFFAPELSDIDKDGDFDLMMSGHESVIQDTDFVNLPVFKFAKNIGSPTVPKFLGWFENPYNLAPQSTIEDMFLISGDLDNDHDIDFLGGEFKDNSTLTFFENSPTPNGKSYFLEPSFTIFGLPFAEVDENLFFPALVDLDGDQDLDMFITRGKDEGFLLEYYRNDQFSGTNGNELFDAIEISPNPAKNEVNIINKSHFQIDRLNIYNSYGVLIYEFANHPDRIDLKPLNAGIYVLEVFSGKTSIRKKLVVMK